MADTTRRVAITYGNDRDVQTSGQDGLLPSGVRIVRLAIRQNNKDVGYR